MSASAFLSACVRSRSWWLAAALTWLTAYGHAPRSWPIDRQDSLSQVIICSYIMAVISTSLSMQRLAGPRGQYLRTLTLLSRAHPWHWPVGAITLLSAAAVAASLVLAQLSPDYRFHDWPIANGIVIPLLTLLIAIWLGSWTALWHVLFTPEFALPASLAGLLIVLASRNALGPAWIDPWLPSGGLAGCMPAATIARCLLAIALPVCLLQGVLALRRPRPW